MRIKKKRKSSFLGIALVAALVFFTAGFFWWCQALSPVSQSPTKSQIFVIRKGEGLSLIARNLKEKGLIKDSLAFKVFVLAKGLSGQIQAGDFRVNPSWNLEEVVHLLTHGSLDIWLTFPEGWRREEYGRRLTANLEDFSYPQFLELTEELEGQLFPDTYLIPRDASPSAIIKIFTRNFEKKFSLNLQLAARKQGLSKDEVITLASMVERESGSDKDSPIIAGIILRRWQNNWPLQIDAAVQYAVANKNNSASGQWQNFNWWPKNLTKADLGINSPYNTYRYKGLPSGPICSPGLASIGAVIYPQKTDYWFYLSDPQGKTHYAETAEEHNQNIARYLK